MPVSERITAHRSELTTEKTCMQSSLRESPACFTLEYGTIADSSEALFVRTSSNSQREWLELSCAKGKDKCIENNGVNYRSENTKGKGKCVKNADIFRLPIPVNGSISAGDGQAENCAVPTTLPQVSTSECPEFRGVRFRGGKFVAEIRPSGWKGEIWLGTFETAEEEAAAYDVGIFFCRKQNCFNFSDSPTFLQGTNIPQDVVALKDTIQQHAKVAAERIRRAAPAVISPDSLVLAVKTTTSSVDIKFSETNWSL